MTRRAILYARVSTDEQARKGYSLPTQFDSCAAYAQQAGYVVPGDEYRIADDFSGAQLHRPGLNRARAMLEQGEAEAIIVHALDRLTRSVAHLILLREEWQRAGVELHSVNRGKSEDNPEQRMAENMEGVFAEYFREKVLEASMRGKRAKARAGKWVGGGSTPYGYARQGKGGQATLKPLKSEARVVRQIFDWYTGAGGKTKLTTSEIAKRLTATGVPPPSRGKKGRGWYRDTVRCVIRNPIYIGEVRFDRTSSLLPELALVDQGTWAAAQVQCQRNKALGRRGARRGYLLPGHLASACAAGRSWARRASQEGGGNSTNTMCVGTSGQIAI